MLLALVSEEKERWEQKNKWGERETFRIIQLQATYDYLQLHTDLYPYWSQVSEQLQVRSVKASFPL